MADVGNESIFQPMTQALPHLLVSWNPNTSTNFAYLGVIQISLFNLHLDVTAEEFVGITYVALVV